MLKYGEEDGKMSAEVVLDMQNENCLVSTAMLTSIWDSTKKDSIDMLVPLVQYCVAETVKVGETVSVSRLLKKFEEEFAFRNFPPKVMEKILGRCCNKKASDFLKKSQRGFQLSRSLESEREEFKRQRREIQEQTDRLIADLQEYLKEHLDEQPDAKRTQEYLTGFLVGNGTQVIGDTSGLKGMTMKSGPINFWIASYIVERYEAKSPMFDYLLQHTGGTMIAQSFYMDERVERIGDRRFNELEVYLDSPLLLCALHYKTDDQYNSCIHLLRTLDLNNARLCCFEHNFQEMYDIVYDYFKGRRDNDKVLEHFEVHDYTSGDMERIMVQLRAMRDQRRIEADGITIEIRNTPDYDNGRASYTDTPEWYLDEKGLKDSLLSDHRWNEAMLEQDIRSIAAIQRLRKGQTANDLSNAQYIWVTANRPLVTRTNTFLNCKSYEQVPLLMTDVDLAAIAWVRYGTLDNREVPRLRLIETARLSQEPTTEIIERFSEALQKMNREGRCLSPDYEAVLRNNYHLKRELMLRAGGNAEAVTPQLITQVVQETFLPEMAQKNQKMEEALKEQEEQQQQIKNQLDEAIREKEEQKKSIRDKLYDKAKKDAQGIAEKEARKAFLLARSITLTAAVILSVGTAAVAICTLPENSYLAVVSLLLAAASVAEFWQAFAQNGWPQKRRKRIENKVYEEEYQRQIEAVLNTLNDENKTPSMV